MYFFLLLKTTFSIIIYHKANVSPKSNFYSGLYKTCWSIRRRKTRNSVELNWQLRLWTRLRTTKVMIHLQRQLLGSYVYSLYSISWWIRDNLGLVSSNPTELYTFTHMYQNYLFTYFVSNRHVIIIVWPKVIKKKW